MKLRTIIFALLSTAMATNAQAAIDFTKLQADADNNFKDLSEKITASTSYHSANPAVNLGLVGFDVSAHASFTDLGDISQLATALNLPAGTDTLILPMFKVSATKGLPFGIDIGGQYHSAVFINGWGLEAKYNALNGNLILPAVAVRGTYSQSTIQDAYEDTNYGIEATVSKGFGIGVKIVPYAGAGMVWSSTSSPVMNPVDPTKKLFKDQSLSAVKYYAGAALYLGFFGFTYEWDTTGKYVTHTAKVGINF